MGEYLETDSRITLRACSEFCPKMVRSDPYQHLNRSIGRRRDGTGDTDATRRYCFVAEFDLTRSRAMPTAPVAWRQRRAFRRLGRRLSGHAFRPRKSRPPIHANTSTVTGRRVRRALGVLPHSGLLPLDDIVTIAQLPVDAPARLAVTWDCLVGYDNGGRGQDIYSPVGVGRAKCHGQQRIRCEGAGPRKRSRWPCRRSTARTL